MLKINPHIRECKNSTSHHRSSRFFIHFCLAPRRSMLYRGSVIPSLWQRGQRLGRVILLRSRKAKPQCRHSQGSKIKRSERSRATDLMMWLIWSSTCRSGIPTIPASRRDDRGVTMSKSLTRCRGVRSDDCMLGIVSDVKPRSQGQGFDRMMGISFPGISRRELKIAPPTARD
jgi:hypothetical protein